MTLYQNIKIQDNIITDLYNKLNNIKGVGLTNMLPELILLLTKLVKTNYLQNTK
jgi:hypothetical protein